MNRNLNRLLKALIILGIVFIAMSLLGDYTLESEIESFPGQYDGVIFHSGSLFHIEISEMDGIQFDVYILNESEGYRFVQLGSLHNITPIFSAENTSELSQFVSSTTTGLHYLVLTPSTNQSISCYVNIKAQYMQDLLSLVGLCCLGFGVLSLMIVEGISLLRYENLE